MLVALVTSVAGEIRAHSKEETTFPEDGAVLAAAPDVVSMTFDEPMRITMIRLTGEAGELVVQRLKLPLFPGDFLQPLRRDALHVGAGPMLVFMEVEQLPAFVDRESELSCPTHEHQLPHRADAC